MNTISKSLGTIAVACAGLVFSGEAKADWSVFVNNQWLWEDGLVSSNTAPAMSVGSWWGYEYFCGVFINNGGDPNSQRKISCARGVSHIALCGTGSGAGATVPDGQPELIAMVNVSTPGGPAYGIWAITDSGHAFLGSLPQNIPVPNAQGALDDCTISWRDYGTLPSGSARDIAFSNGSYLSATLYIIGSDNHVYSYIGNQWHDTAAAEPMAQIGWSVRTGALWGIGTSGMPYEGIPGVPARAGSLQWSARVGAPVSPPPYCGLAQFSPSAFCTMSVSGNVNAMWDPSRQVVSLAQWKGSFWGSSPATADAFWLLASGDPPSSGYLPSSRCSKGWEWEAQVVSALRVSKTCCGRWAIRLAFTRGANSRGGFHASDPTFVAPRVVDARPGWLA